MCSEWPSGPFSFLKLGAQCIQVCPWAQGTHAPSPQVQASPSPWSYIWPPSLMWSPQNEKTPLLMVNWGRYYKSVQDKDHVRFSLYPLVPYPVIFPFQILVKIQGLKDKLKVRVWSPSAGKCFRMCSLQSPLKSQQAKLREFKDLFTHQILQVIRVYMYLLASFVAHMVTILPAMHESIPGSGRSPGEENGNPLDYSCLENPKDRGAWRAIVYRVMKSQTLTANTEQLTLSLSFCEESVCVTMEL